MNPLRILHTNDLHGSLPGPALERLRELRDKVDVYFDSGDAIRTGNLGIPLVPDPVWPVLSDLRCTASTLGNRETHPVESVFQRKIQNAAHPIVVANMARASGHADLPPHVVIEVNGLRVGVLGVMVPMATEAMRTKSTWSRRWQNPISSAISAAQALRPQVDCVFALTHIGLRRDRELANAAGGAIDVIFGGHSHDVLPKPEVVGTTYIVHGGSHARYAGVYEWSHGRLSGELVSLREPSR